LKDLSQNVRSGLERGGFGAVPVAVRNPAPPFVGQASSFLKVIERLSATARSEATVLVSGETGTGKELAARAIHSMSERARFAFVAVNCGSLPDTLLEDQLFGHERGAYTGAHIRRPGLIAQARKGTLFLDEIDALTLRAQVALLRLLQDKTFMPVGSSREQQADVRIIAATNSNLESRVQSGSFRADLYYRLRVLSIHLPPLRHRREDIVPLSLHFLRKHSPPHRLLQLAPCAMQAVQSLDWPGNVRELENAIIRACQLCHGMEIGIEDLGVEVPEPAAPVPMEEAANRSFREEKEQIIASFERRYLKDLMARHLGNVSQAARAAGKERRDLGKMLKKYQIDPRTFHVATVSA
jgi:DNA-binding NtrC family response regulator